MKEPFAQSASEKQERNWVPIVIGLALVVLIVAAIAIAGRSRPAATPGPDPYAVKLQPSDMVLSASDNFVGATVTYLDLKLTNSGDKTLVGGQVEATFKNTLNEVVQKEVVPIRVLQPNQLGGYPDNLDLSVSPIAPGQTKTIRLTLEHVSSDWNQTAPDLRFINLKVK